MLRRSIFQRGCLFVLATAATALLPSVTASATASQVTGAIANHSPSASGLSGVLEEPSSLGSSAGMQAVYNFLLSAKKSVDITVYTFVDPTMVQDLASDVQRGVKVRVILDTNLEHKTNAATFTALQKAGVSVVWAWTTYHATHEKCYIVDDKEALVSSINADDADYPNFRDFGVWDTDSADVSAIEAVFNADFAHKAITPSDGSDLVWSPGSEPALLAVVNGAKKTLSLETEELSSASMVSALVAAAKRGVDVEVTMTNETTYDSEWSEIVAAGGHVHLYADSSKALYIHAKVISADAGLSDQKIYVGSINFSTPSMNDNRELGIITTSSSIVKDVSGVVNGDFENCSAAKDCSNYTA
jgi:cardiolipin synthase A/B